MFIFNQSKTNEVIAIFAKPNAWRDRHFRLGQQEFRKLHRAKMTEFVRDLRPDKHRAFWFWDVPANPVKAIDEDITATAIALSHRLDIVLRTIECMNSCNLYRLKNSVIKIAFQPRQCAQCLRIAT